MDGQAMEGGKYDDEAMEILEKNEAALVLVAVAGGVRGHGLSIATKDPAELAALPGLFRDIAMQIEMSMARGDPLLLKRHQRNTDGGSSTVAE